MQKKLKKKSCIPSSPFSMTSKVVQRSSALKVAFFILSAVSASSDGPILGETYRQKKPGAKQNPRCLYNLNVDFYFSVWDWIKQMTPFSITKTLRFRNNLHCLTVIFNLNPIKHCCKLGKWVCDLQQLAALGKCNYLHNLNRFLWLVCFWFTSVAVIPSG